MSRASNPNTGIGFDACTVHDTLKFVKKIASISVVEGSCSLSGRYVQGLAETERLYCWGIAGERPCRA